MSALNMTDAVVSGVTADIVAAGAATTFSGEAISGAASDLAETTMSDLAAGPATDLAGTTLSEVGASITGAAVTDVAAADLAGTAQGVPPLSFVTIGISLLAAFVIPAGLFFFMRRKFDCKKSAFFIGCLTFAVFALLLEGIFHSIILAGGRGQALMAKPLLYGLYGGFMAGLFEESGRFLAFKSVLKKSQDDDSTALMFGAGHGAFEAFYLLFMTALVNLVFAVLINTGNTELVTKNVSPSALESMEKNFELLQTANPLYFLAALVERIPAVVIHISLSILVWFGAKNRDKWFFYPLAIFLHMALDALVAVLSLYKVNTFILEILIYILAAAFLWLAVVIWKKYGKIKI